MREIARDQRKQVARLPMRVAPDGPVTACGFRLARAFEIAVGEQNRRLAAIRFEPDAIGRQHVRTIEEIRDPAKALGLALGAVGGAGTIKAHQLGVGRGIEARLDPEHEGPLRRAGKQELRGARLEASRFQRPTVEFRGYENKVVAIKGEGNVGAAGRIGSDRQGRDDARRVAVERYVKVDRVDEEIRDTIIDEANGLPDRSAHGRWPFRMIDWRRSRANENARARVRLAPG